MEGFESQDKGFFLCWMWVCTESQWKDEGANCWLLSFFVPGCRGKCDPLAMDSTEELGSGAWLLEGEVWVTLP